MPKIVFNRADGSQQIVEARPGASIMDTATRSGVPGIVAECGGAMACATCHVYVADDYLPLVGEVGEFEDEMLDDAAAERTANSRLSCQIRMTDELDGIEVTVAPEQ
ncbi:(2Fe-2S)-binding protein [Prauserella sp. PE36]|uniref:(2Fe-2S)-binding protein n=1 Tax=Prauserella endophytica TaxID=1592324 RepID=A0ABY2S9J0_9PSEU|nr:MULTISPECIES: 2Fe-2S iron-sulfur cluster-binding protein [Prauserella]PXY23038.1 (2Fe-2S)-binding protein [Prauserella coralliicola]RBM17202.1 (2Fe-2S)-binding protein [Prauserella sp. PE36]TKG72568.1 (2Fe-2S)-binding protein [Prauserella endophytica]